MEFYAGKKYFIHPTYSVDGLCAMQIYLRKGSDVKLTVWNAANRRFDLSTKANFWQPHIGFKFKSLQRDADMLIKVQQKPELTTESNHQHPRLEYIIGGNRVSDKVKLGDSVHTSVHEQQAHLWPMKDSVIYNIHCAKPHNNQEVKIGFWWDPKVLGPEEEIGKKGFDIKQYGH